MFVLRLLVNPRYWCKIGSLGSCFNVESLNISAYEHNTNLSLLVLQ